MPLGHIGHIKGKSFSVMGMLYLYPSMYPNEHHSLPALLSADISGRMGNNSFHYAFNLHTLRKIITIELAQPLGLVVVIMLMT
jgi:hypothetical protein